MCRSPRSCTSTRLRRTTRSAPRGSARRARSGCRRPWSTPSSTRCRRSACGTWTCPSRRRGSGLGSPRDEDRARERRGPRAAGGGRARGVLATATAARHPRQPRSGLHARVARRCPARLRRADRGARSRPGHAGRGRLGRVAPHGGHPGRLCLRRARAGAARLSADDGAGVRVPAVRRRAQGARADRALRGRDGGEHLLPVRHRAARAAAARILRVLMLETLGNLGLGFSVALSPPILFYAFVGCLVGTLVGVLPGVGPLAGISLLLPATFGLDATRAIVMLAGIYYGA